MFGGEEHNMSTTYLDGNFDEIRLSRGIAYTTNFVPRTSSYGKMLVVSSDNAYGIGSMGTFQQLASDWSSKSDADKLILLESVYGMPSASDLSTISPFKCILLSDLSSASVRVLALPKPQLVTPKGLIDTTSFEKINYVTITSTESVADTSINHITLIVTTDNTTYYTWNKITLDWVEIDHTNLEQVQQNGIKPSELSTLTSADWDKLIKKPNVEGIGFAYYLEQSDFDDVVEVDEISLNVDMIGSWANAKVGTDYDYEYPSNKSLLVTLLSDGDYKINY